MDVIKYGYNKNCPVRLCFGCLYFLYFGIKHMFVYFELVKTFCIFAFVVLRDHTVTYLFVCITYSKYVSCLYC